MSVGRVALLVAHGPEARAFLQSGLAQALARSYDLAIISTRPDAAAIQASGLPALPGPWAAESPRMRRCRAVRSRAEGLSPRLARALAQAEWSAGRRWGGSREWRSFFRREGVGAVVAGGCRGVRDLTCLQSAANEGLPTAVLLNSWKDLDKSAAIGLQPDAIGVFTEREAAALRAVNPGLRPRVCGSLHVAALRRAEPLDRHVFCHAAGLDPQRPYLLYIAARQQRGEERLVARLAVRLRLLDPDLQILVRINPMADSRSFEPLQELAHVRLQKPRWEWLPGAGWCCPLPSDLEHYRAALEHAEGLVGSASTAAWDGAAFGRRMVSPAYGPTAAGWHAAGYREASEQGWTVPADDEAELAEIACALRPSELRLADFAVERASDLVEQALGGESFATGAAA